MSRIVIGDVHGQIQTLLALIAKLPSGIPITFCGDLIDRGPGSKQVIDFILENGHDCVRGNHEQMLLEETSKLEDGSLWVMSWMNGIWLMNGGDKCLNSYNPDGLTKEDEVEFFKHRDWIKGLPVYLEYPITNDKGQKLLVTHSTAWRHWDNRNGTAQQIKQFEQTTMWERTSMPPKIPGYYNVYGHTPQLGGPTVKEHYACIDGGSYFKPGGGYGRITALQFPEMIVYEQENLDTPGKSKQAGYGE